MKTLKLTTLFILILQISLAQKVSVIGYIRDAETGEDLIGATVYVEQILTGTISNEYGFYSLNLNKGFYTFHVSYLGYQTQSFTLSVDDKVTQNIKLLPVSEQISEVVVSTDAVNQNIIGTEMGTFKLDPKIIKAIPVLLGEQDVLKTIQLMPGVATTGEGGTGFFVRGGQADHNLVLLDDAPVYNPSHLLGFFSVFNSDALNDVKLYKGGVPAQYGGRASSVLDIRMREGNSERYAASGGIGIISSRITLEGPLGNNGSSFLISGRRTYADLFLLFAKNEMLKSSKLYFYDLNMKTHFDIGEKDRIYFSGYMGRDALKTSIFGFDWGNKAGIVRWTHVFSSKLFSNTSLIYNDYNYDTQADLDFNFSLKAGITGKTIKQRFTYYAHKNHTLMFGFELNNHIFKPGSLKLLSPQTEEQNFNMEEKFGNENAFYFSNEHKILPQLTVNYGIRYSHFTRSGQSNEYSFDIEGNATDTTFYSDGLKYSPYNYFEPRLNANYVFNQNLSIKAGYNRMTQFIHLLQNATAGTPIDYWIPSSPIVKPQIADQISIGVFRNLANHNYKLSTELYYKNMKNQIDYKTGASLLLNDLVETELLFGKGKAYGAEFLIEKTQGTFTGWIAYTLSRSLRKIEGINRGNWYSSRQDRIHDLSIVAMYQLTPSVNLSASWVYYTGDAVTFPAGKYIIDGYIANLYTERNGYRMPDYHRLDVGMTWTIANRGNYRSELNFSVYNAYCQKNPYSYVFSEDSENPGQTKTTMIYLFSAIPSISWNFKF